MNGAYVEINWTQSGSSLLKIDGGVIEEWRAAHPDDRLVDIQQIATWIEQEANGPDAAWSSAVLDEWNGKDHAEFCDAYGYGDLEDEWLTPDEIGALS